MKLRRYIALLLSVLLTLSGAALCPVSAEPGNGDTFKVLFIGNSASEDLTDGGFANDSMLYDAVKSMVGDECEVTVGLCAKGGKSMAWHATAAMRNTPDAYSFRIVGGGDPTWRVASYGCTSAYALGYADWDAVVIQPWGQETLTGKSTGGNEEASTLRELSASVPYMLDHIAANAPGAKVYYYHVWSAPTVKERWDRDDNPLPPSYSTALKDYLKICKTTEAAASYVGKESGLGITGVLPVGAAIQNARETYFALLDWRNPASPEDEVSLASDPQWGLHRDGLHLSLEIGRYIAAQAAAGVLVTESMRADGYEPSHMRASAAIGKLPDEYESMARYIAAATLEKMSAGGDGRYAPIEMPEEYRTDTLPSVADELSRRSYRLKSQTSPDDIAEAFKDQLTEVLEPLGITASVTVKSLPENGRGGDVSATAVLKRGYASSAAVLNGTLTLCADGTGDGDYKVLFIGGDMASDIADFGHTEGSVLYDAVRSLLGDEKNVTVGICTSEGADMARCAGDAADGNGGYGLSVIGGHIIGEGAGEWRAVYGDCTSAEALAYTDWNAVVLQPSLSEAASGKSDGVESESLFTELSESVGYMIDHVSRYAPGAKIYYAHMWNAVSTCHIDAGLNGYSDVVSVTKAAEGYCGTESGVGLSGVLPIGAAVQRARGTYLAELDFSDPQGLDPQIGLQRDGIHLSFEVGRYIAALTAAEVLVPDGMRTDEYRLPDMRPSPVIGELPAEYGEIARESAAKAVSTMNRGGDGRYYAVNMINSYRTSPVDTAAEDAQRVTPSIRNAADLDGAVTAWCEALLKYNGIRKVEVSIVPDDGVSLDDGVLCGKAHLSFGYMSTDVSVRAIYRSDSFADVSDNVWYCEHVVYAYAHGLINGMSPTAFEPNTRMSRAMLVTVLWRLEGAPEADGESAFTDLTQDWYRAAVEWANGAGIVLGVSSDRFAPDEDVTREQIAAVMYRYAEYKGMDTSVRARLDAFRDAGEISDWARDAISFAVRIGLMKGMSETTFNPRGYATRAEVVTILHRYMEI